MVEDRGDRLGVTTATCGEMGMRIDEPGQRVRIRWRFAATLLATVDSAVTARPSLDRRAKAHSMGPILARPAMGRVVAHADAQSRSVSEMLGLPDSITVALSTWTGTTDTASVHLTAWTEAFNDFLAHVTDADGNTPVPFTDADYLAHVDGRPREDGITAFLTARHITVDDAAVAKLAQDKKRPLPGHPGPRRVTPPRRGRLPAGGARRGLGIAVVTSSKNGGPVLEAAGLTGFVTHRVDGNVIVERGLK